MDVPGAIAMRAIISPTCRANRGDLGAFDEAARRLRDEYERCLPYHGERGSKFHLTLSIEKDEPEHV